jgi:hypothetical protein
MGLGCVRTLLRGSGRIYPSGYCRFCRFIALSRQVRFLIDPGDTGEGWFMGSRRTI